MAQAKYEIRRKCPICGAIFQIYAVYIQNANNTQ